MRTCLLLLAILALACCRRAEPHRAPEPEWQQEYEAWAARQPRPPAHLVDHIEVLLAQEPCIGSLDRWSRNYGYDYLPEKTVDTGIVDFHFDEAGSADLKAGRHIIAPDSWANLDELPIPMVSGDYDVKENRIRIAFCGNNVGGQGKGDVNNMRAYIDELKRRRLAHRT